jgi:Type II secretion system (T2SS), protein M subtype b
MTTSPNQAHARRALLVLAGIIGLAAAWTYVSLADLSERTEVVRQKETEIAALRQRASGRSNASAAGLVDPFLHGASATLATNALQERVVRVLEEAGGNVISVSVEPRPATQPGSQGQAVAEPGQRLVLQVMAETTIDGVQKVVHRLEGEAPALIIESLLIDRRTAGAAELGDAARPARLRLELRIAGFARKGEP